MEFEKAHGYKNYGLTGTSNFKDADGKVYSQPQTATKEEARAFYRHFVYSKEAGYDLEGLPAPLASMAIDVGVNQGDVGGMLMLAAGKLHGNLHDTQDNTINFDKTAKDNLWFGSGDSVKVKSGELSYQETDSFALYEKNKAEIVRLYNEDPKAFLESLTEARMEMYSRTSAELRDKKFGEWSERAFASYDLANEMLSNPDMATANISSKYASSNTYKNAGAEFASYVGNASGSADNTQWYTKLDNAVAAANGITPDVNPQPAADLVTYSNYKVSGGGNSEQTLAALENASQTMKDITDNIRMNFGKTNVQTGPSNSFKDLKDIEQLTAINNVDFSKGGAAAAIGNIDGIIKNLKDSEAHMNTGDSRVNAGMNHDIDYTTAALQKVENDLRAIQAESGKASPNSAKLAQATRQLKLDMRTAVAGYTQVAVGDLILESENASNWHDRSFAKFGKTADDDTLKQAIMTLGGGQTEDGRNLGAKTLIDLRKDKEAYDTGKTGKDLDAVRNVLTKDFTTSIIEGIQNTNTVPTQAGSTPNRLDKNRTLGN